MKTRTPPQAADKPDWLEQVWIDVNAEIAYETRHPQEPFCTCGPYPSRCAKHGDVDDKHEWLHDEVRP